MMRTCKFASAAIVVTSLLLHTGGCYAAEVAQPTGAAAAIPHKYFSLIHSPAVHKDLRLTLAQEDKLRTLTDRLDVLYFPAQSQSGKQALMALIAEAQTGVAEILDANQLERLNQIACRAQGTSALLRDDVIQKLALLPGQVDKIRGIITDIESQSKEIQQKGASAETQKELEDLRQQEMKKLTIVLSREQQQGWLQLAGNDFDFSQVTQGPFKVPEFQEATTWINSNGMKLSDLRGRVVVVHFYCFGCINCIHNFPSYRKWLDHFEGQDVTIVGIHSPETQAEHNITAIRQRAASEKLNFPILVDSDMKTWKAWGNTMWPSVYVIDKKGYLRSWWQGELNWQGANGEEQMRQKIEALLKE
ncbi:redoxin domain-containing protein [bacterium]|nr:redoxin domain-containing protein [bacterium]